jgi:hypothetical protein
MTTNNGVLMFGSTGEECLRLVRESGDAGMTANEICVVTGASSSRVTAALHHLHEHQCVRREKRPVPGENSQYPTHRAHRSPTRRSGPAPRGVLIMVPIGDRDTMPLDFDQARKVYGVLHEIFGEKA